MYLNWDGRGLSLAGFLQYALLKYASNTINIVVWSIVFCCNSFVFYKIVMLELEHHIRNSKKYTFILYAFLTVVLWLGMSSHISQTVYWATGGVYICGCLLGNCLIYTILTVIKKDLTKLSGLQKSVLFIFVCFLGFVAGSTAQNLVPAFFLFFILQYIISYNIIRFQGFVHRLYITGFITMLLGALFLFIAPGNYLRARLGPNSMHWDCLQMLYHGLYTLSYYVYKSIALIISGSIAAYVLYLTSMNNDISRSESKRSSLFNEIKRSNLYDFINIYKWLFVALATILPFVFISDFVSARTSIFFMNFLCLFMLIRPFKLLVKPQNTGQVIQSSTIFSPKSSLKFMLIVFIVHLIIITKQISSAYTLKVKIMQRYAFFDRTENKGKNIVVFPIKQSVPITMKFDDISSDSCFWINKTFARYYSLHTVYVKK
jgi:hypothetical protein